MPKKTNYDIVPVKPQSMDLVERAGNLARISTNSRDTYRYQMKAFTKFCQEKGKEPDFDMLIKWIDGTKNGSTQALRLAAAKKVLTEIYRNDPRLLELKESLKDIQPARKNRAITDTGYLKKPEIDKLIKKSPPYLARIIELLFWTGLRISEALNIELENCVRVKGIMEIRVFGKRKKEAIVYLNGKFFDDCKKYFHSQKYLIEHEGRQYSREYITRQISFYGDRILGKDISAHIFRHSKACYLRDVMKLPIDKIQKALNHSSMETTAAFYLHGRASAAEQGIKK